VRYKRRWHLFCTIRSRKRTHQIEYLSFADWKDAARAPRHILKGRAQYLTVVEAQGNGRRYYKAYLADRLDGAWKPLAATAANPFAASINVQDRGPHCADSISHGELIRTGFDQLLEIDPNHLRFVIQGVDDAGMLGKPYGEIP